MKKIPLSRGLFALVDDDLYDYLSQWKWHASKSKKTFYAARFIFPNGRKHPKMVLMHRLVMGDPPGRMIDHRNKNGLDNQRHNLRQATNQTNQMNRSPNHDNTSGYIGVSWHTASQKWIAQLSVGGKSVFLGRHKNLDDAIAARKEGEKKYFAPFFK